jgi:hypothetical protein
MALPRSCMQLLSCHDRPVIHSASISSPAPHPHCVSWIRLLELGNSVQKHILRLYIIKYSNLGTMNASSIRWSAAASKLEHGRPRCNLLDALACSNLAICLMPLLRQKHVPGWLQPPPLAAAYLVTVSPWLCFYLSTMCPFLVFSCSPARPVTCSHQWVLLLLALIASLFAFLVCGSEARGTRVDERWARQKKYFAYSLNRECFT